MRYQHLVVLLQKAHCAQVLVMYDSHKYFLSAINKQIIIQPVGYFQHRTPTLRDFEVLYSHQQKTLIKTNYRTNDYYMYDVVSDVM